MSYRFEHSGNIAKEERVRNERSLAGYNLIVIGFIKSIAAIDLLSHGVLGFWGFGV